MPCRRGLQARGGGYVAPACPVSAFPAGGAARAAIHVAAMSSESSDETSPDASKPAATPPPSPVRPTLAALFSTFFAVSLSGFGGALPWARRMIVERRRWMTAEEFNEAFALSQFLPGPNTVNFAVVFGTRFGGAGGAVAAFAGLMGPPLVIITALAFLYERYGDIDTLGHVLSGIAAAAAGLLIAMVAKMAAPLFVKRWDWAVAVALLAFVGVAIMQWPLPYVFLALAPVSVAIAWLVPARGGRR